MAKKIFWKISGLIMCDNLNVSVNIKQCKKVGKTLKELSIRPEFYKREFLSFEADRETKLRVYFLSAAICHQTYNLFNKEKNLWGWDFMEYAFLQMQKEKSALLNPGYLCIYKEADLTRQLQKSFSYDGNINNCTLDRLEERTEMLLEICFAVKEKFKRNISELIDSTDGLLFNNGTGLYETLSQFTAFSDPQKKKITFFLKLATDAGLIRLKDSENIVPIMDYHMQRVLLRMGCVEIQDEELKEKLIRRKVLDSDVEIRQTCIKAIKVIAKISGHGILKMNDFFWPLGRSCCNETTLCNDGHCSKEPCTFYTMVDIASHKNCSFEDSCKGSENYDYMKLWEPVVETHFY